MHRADYANATSHLQLFSYVCTRDEHEQCGERPPLTRATQSSVRTLEFDAPRRGARFAKLVESLFRLVIARNARNVVKNTRPRGEGEGEYKVIK